MDRQEAIKILYEIHADAFEKDNCWLKEHADSLLKYLNQPLTLVDLLGWEEGAKYKYKGPSVLKVENNRLYAKSRECSSGWCNFTLFTDEIEDLRQAKKIEKKEIKEELLDELQELVSNKEINEIIEKLRGLDNE